MAERGVMVAHSTILRRVTKYVPEYEKRWHRFSSPAGTFWRCDETYVSIRGQWHYLYREVDKEGKKDSRFLLRRDRGIAAAQSFFRKSFDNAAITIAGIELAHRIRKRQFSFGVGRPRRERSLKVLWERAIA